MAPPLCRGAQRFSENDLLLRNYDHLNRRDLTKGQLTGALVGGVDNLFPICQRATVLIFAIRKKAN